MCIRDRNKASVVVPNLEEVVSIKGESLDAPIHDFVFKGITVEPVSYTHLDVYKRQNLW